MSQKFSKALEFTLKWEVGLDKNGNLKYDGGYVVDTGGETKWGISARANPGVVIRELTLEQACEIYRNKYWGALSCDNHEIGLAVALFDTGVNVGVSRAGRWLNKLEDNPSPVKDKAKALVALREGHYFNLKSLDQAKYGKYLHGWLNRTNDLKKFIDIVRLEQT